MQHMERRLVAKIDGLDARTGGLETRMGNLENRMGSLETKMEDLKVTLIRRMDSLEEDLTATMKDSLTIRRHVGMTLPDED